MSFAPPVFNVNENPRKWRNYLDSEGYVVLTDILNSEQYIQRPGSSGGWACLEREWRFTMGLGNRILCGKLELIAISSHRLKLYLILRN